jgi:hypothetical protein
MTTTVLLVVLGGVVIAAIVYIGAYLAQRYGDFREVGTDTPCIVMFMGDSYVLSAYLLHSPSGSSDFQTVKGSIEFFRIGDCFTLSGSSIPGVVSVNTGPLPQDQFLIADGVHKQWSLVGAQQTVNGIAVGEGEIQISGESEAGEVHKEISVPVTVVADDGRTTLIDLFKIASKKAGEIWSHGIFGNFLANFFKGQSKGLCDHWADWTARWFKQHNNGEICKIEKVWFGENNWWRVDHVCVRITMCESGKVYYVDPHQDPESPIFEKEEYEDQWTRGTPSSSAVIYSQ